MGDGGGRYDITGRGPGLLEAGKGLWQLLDCAGHCLFSLQNGMETVEWNGDSGMEWREWYGKKTVEWNKDSGMEWRQWHGMKTVE